MTIGGALPANARDWEEYVARFDRSISDGLPAGPLRPDDETAWKAVAKNYAVTNKITNLETATGESWPRFKFASCEWPTGTTPVPRIYSPTFPGEIGYFWWECYTEKPDAAAEAIAEG